MVYSSEFFVFGTASRNLPKGLHCKLWISFGLVASSEGYLFRQNCVALSFSLTALNEIHATWIRMTTARMEPLSSAYHVIWERDKLVAEMMRCMLFKIHQHPGVPVRREELTQLVTKNYRQRNLPAVVIAQAQKKFASIFGYEMKELQRSRPSKSNNVRSSQQSMTDSKSYILKSMLPEELRTKLVENKETSHFLGLTFAVVGIVQLAGGKVPEDILWQYLRRLGLDEHDEKHPHFGNVKQAIETIIKQRYIQKDKVHGPEGDVIVYELAERALDEIVNGRLQASITQIVKQDIPMTEASEA